MLESIVNFEECEGQKILYIIRIVQLNFQISNRLTKNLCSRDVNSSLMKLVDKRQRSYDIQLLATILGQYTLLTDGRNLYVTVLIFLPRQNHRSTSLLAFIVLLRKRNPKVAAKSSTSSSFFDARAKMEKSVETILSHFNVLSLSHYDRGMYEYMRFIIIKNLTCLYFRDLVVREFLIYKFHFSMKRFILMHTCKVSERLIC